MRGFSIHKSGILLLFLTTVLLTMGCTHTSAKAAPTDRVASYAISPDTDTRLKRVISGRAAAYPGMSGFKLLETGQESFAMRLALIENAEKSIDMQYYAIHDDVTANLLMNAIVRAAERGVRVRFIIDAINLGEVKDTFAALDKVNKIEIRAFNPLTTQKQNFIERMFTRITNLGSLNRRMHNKALIADNQLAIMGGRNLGDAYFEEFTNTTFKDIDIIATGKIVPEISRSFDEYWNNENTISLADLDTSYHSEESIARVIRELAVNWYEKLQTPEGRALLENHMTDDIKDGKINLVWARARMDADDPDKIDPEAERTGEDVSEPLMRLDELLENAQDEFIIVSPYFVPMDTGVEWLTELEQKGIQVKVLTNSLASTDIVAVHTGYEDYRKELLENGIEIFELKPIAGESPSQRLAGMEAPAQTSLHSKVFVIDRAASMIGSFNLDPRSINLNTEAMLSIYSPILSGQLAGMFEEVTAPDRSYRLMLDKNGSMIWVEGEGENQKVYYTEPSASFGRHLQSLIMSLLPIEKHL